MKKIGSKNLVAVVLWVISSHPFTALAYSLFNPTPSDKMREFTSDRPGATNSPYTIDAGHYQLELAFANYFHFSQNGTTTNQLQYPNPFFRIGISENSEIDIDLLPQVTEWTNDGQTSQRTSGIGDLDLIYKHNFHGNDGGPFSWTIMLGVNFPTSTNGIANDKIEPFAMFPIGFNLPDDWDLVLMPEIDLNKDLTSDGMHIEFNLPATAEHDLIGNLSGFLQIVSHLSTEQDIPNTLFFGAGFAMLAEKDMQFDLGCNIGLNSNTPQTNLSAGWTIRR